MRRPALIFVLAGLVGALVATPIAVYAAHNFNDVPNTNTFHADIEWLDASGVTKGCNPPANTEFCPKDEVTREQMAAFLRRFAQYLDAEDGTPAQADNASSLDGLDSDDFAQSSQLMHATVTQGGSLQYGNALSATRSSEGVFELTFGRNLNNCSGTASAGTTNSNAAYNIGITTAVLLSGSQATVRLANSYIAPGDAFWDSPFHVVIVCPGDEPSLLSSSGEPPMGDPDANGDVTP